jgi:hypothetical protein
MNVISQDSISSLAKLILAEGLKEGSYVVNVYEIVNGEHEFKKKYDSFIEFSANVNDFCDGLGRYNDFYFEWESDD